MLNKNPRSKYLAAQRLMDEYRKKYADKPLSHALRRLETLNNLHNFLRYIFENAADMNARAKNQFDLINAQFEKYQSHMANFGLDDGKYERQMVELKIDEEHLLNGMVGLLNALPNQITINNSDTFTRYPVNKDSCRMEKIEGLRAALYFDTKRNESPLYIPEVLMLRIYECHWGEILKNENAKKFVLATAKKFYDIKVATLTEAALERIQRAMLPQDYYEMYQSALFISDIGKAIVKLENEREHLSRQHSGLAEKKVQAITKTLFKIRTVYQESATPVGMQRIHSIRDEDRKKIYAAIDHNLTRNKSLGSWGARIGNFLLNIINRISMPKPVRFAEFHGLHAKPKNINEDTTTDRRPVRGQSHRKLTS